MSEEKPSWPARPALWLVVVLAGAAAADGVDVAPRLRKAVMSPPVGTMATTSQPSADFSVSLAASAAGSNEEVLTLMYSDMVGTLQRETADETCRITGTSRTRW